MIGLSRKLRISLLLLALTGSSLVVTCGGNGKPPPAPEGEQSPAPMVQPVKTTGTEQAPPVEDVVITIGNHSDLTGPAANCMQMINHALEDVVGYYNKNNRIPGMKFKVVTYDSQVDPSRDIPGYEWLISKGADFIFTPMPSATASFKPRADEDKVVVFTATGSIQELNPPGYVFSLGVVPQYEAMTLLKWIAENHWDYQTRGPAQIGGTAWTEGGTRRSGLKPHKNTPGPTLTSLSGLADT